MDFTQVLNSVVDLVFVIAGGGVAWLATNVVTWLKMENDKKVRALIESALYNALAFAKSQLVQKIQAEGYTKEVKDQVIGLAHDYVSTHVPDSLTKLNITSGNLSEKLEARLENIIDADKASK